MDINMENLTYDTNDENLRKAVWMKAEKSHSHHIEYSPKYRLRTKEFDVYGKEIEYNKYGNQKGGWEIDHIIPQCEGKNTTELEILNKYWNLQPLSYEKNHYFGGRIKMDGELKIGYDRDGKKHYIDYFIREFDMVKRGERSNVIPFIIINGRVQEI